MPDDKNKPQQVPQTVPPTKQPASPVKRNDKSTPFTESTPPNPFKQPDTFKKNKDTPPQKKEGG